MMPGPKLLSMSHKTRVDMTDSPVCLFEPEGEDEKKKVEKRFEVFEVK
jgi:hypothetical protein